MHLYLVQHAEAKSEEEDPERSLSDKGRNDIRKVASFLSGLKNLSTIFHSGKTRARQTAEVLSAYLRPANGISEAGGLKPMDDLSVWIKRLEGIEEDTMLVGHLPHLSKLASALLCQDENRKVIAFQMGGVVCLSRDESGNYLLAWMVTPQMYE
jgi:phosphohistidine phosphatase